ncbi:MAG TPA: hypothetical protein VF039_07920 [Longimicrobiales bacterium]
MSFWKRLFATDAAATARGEYQQLLAQARKATLPTDRARLLNVAGDLALSTGAEDDALLAFSDALDIFLRDRDYHAARAVARKLLRFRANTVRVRSTLAWLAIAQDLPADARIALDLYVTSLKAQGERDWAVRHLSMMSRATRDTDLREAIAEHLESLDARQPAAELRARLSAEADGSMEPPTDQAVRARLEEALERLISPAGGTPADGMTR